jgi:hypothetical protein
VTLPGDIVRGWDPDQRVWNGVGAGRPALHDPSIAPNGVVYQFQNDLTDSSGNGRDLSLSFGTERYGDLYPGLRGFHFDGATKLNFSTTGTDLEELGDHTFGCLVHFHHIGTLLGTDNNKFLFLYEAAGESAATNVLYGVTMAEQNTRFFSETGNGTNVLFDNPNRPTNFECMHFGYTKTSGVVQFYFNGIASGAPSGTLTAPTGGTSASLHIGGVASGDTNLCGEFVIASMFIEPGTAFTAQGMADAYNATLGPTYGRVSP